MDHANGDRVIGPTIQRPPDRSKSINILAHEKSFIRAPGHCQRQFTKKQPEHTVQAANQITPSKRLAQA
jgi:hypothetical protein